MTTAKPPVSRRTIPGKSLPAIIDPHVHFWDRDLLRYPWLEDPTTRDLPRRYGPEQWEADTASIVPHAFVHIQAEVDHHADPVAETAWLDSLRPSITMPFAIVGYADLRGRDLRDVLDRHESYPGFRGIRQEAWFDPDSTRADVPRTNLLDDPALVEGLGELERRDLLFELLVWPRQLRHAAQILSDLPDLAVAINHTGLPPAGGDQVAWARDLAHLLEASPRSVLKISGLGFLDKGWRPEIVDSIISTAIDIAGPRRAMFASNHPAEPRGVSYSAIWTTFDRVTRERDHGHRSSLFGGTAARFYRIDGLGGV